jgi:hypothetical protein
MTMEPGPAVFFRNVAAQTAYAASNQPHLRHQNPPFSFFDGLLANHRFAFRLADVTLEPLAQILGELLIYLSRCWNRL